MQFGHDTIFPRFFSEMDESYHRFVRWIRYIPYEFISYEFIRIHTYEFEHINSTYSANIIEVHGVDVGDRDATNAVDDDIVFVTGWRSDGKVTGARDAKEDGAGVGGGSCCRWRYVGAERVAAVVTTSTSPGKKGWR